MNKNENNAQTKSFKAIVAHLKKVLTSKRYALQEVLL